MSELDKDCERWAEIADRRMLDETVSDEDARFAEEHLAGCEACRAEAAAWSELRERGADSLDADDAAELVERALAETTEAKKMPLARPAPTPSYAPSAGIASLDRARKNRTAQTAGLVAAALALAAGALLWVRGKPSHDPNQVARLASASGDVRLAGSPVSEGALLPEGAHLVVGAGSRACLAFDGGRIKTCLDASSELAVTKGMPGARELELFGGTAVTALDKLPPGQTFSVFAVNGRATVTGTVFSVSATPDGKSVVVRVHDGSVRTDGAGAAGKSVRAGQELDVVSGQGHAVDASVRDHELELVGVTLPRPGHEEPAPSATAEQPAPTPSPSSSAEEPTTKIASPAEMLEAARKARAAGNTAGAAEGYRKLMLAHPRSAEAHAALVSLAELQLGPLGDPAGALRSYDGYLRSGGGALTQEARYGKIQALRRLGRTSEERAAVDEFVKAYPNSVQARALRARGEAADAGP